MSFSVTPEQLAFRDTVRSFLAQNSGEDQVRAAMSTDPGYDPAVWSRLSGQLGVTGLGIPEQYGGSGYGFEEVALVLEETGRSLLCAPLLSCVVATAALLHCGDESARADLLPGIAAGTTIATVALTNPPSSWNRQGSSASATERGGRWQLTGAAPYVLDGHGAGLILVPAKTPDGVGLFAVDGGDRGITRTLLATLDQTRRLARVEFASARARLLGAPDSGGPVLDQVLRIAAVALAAEQAGVAGAATDMAVEYAKQRIQFGQPIGTFQAIKHTCADLHVAVESARSAARAAARAVAGEAADLAELAAIAGSFCGEACLLAGRENIQVHGGIGFTWEHPAHLYYKRAKTSEFLFGDVQYHREMLAGVLGLERSAS